MNRVPNKPPLQGPIRNPFIEVNKTSTFQCIVLFGIFLGGLAALVYAFLLSRNP